MCWYYIGFNPSFLLSKFTTLSHTHTQLHTDCRNPNILQSFQPSPNRLDVYLGQTQYITKVDGLDHALQGGWLGWIPYHEQMTYRDAQVLIASNFPVSISESQQYCMEYIIIVCVIVLCRNQSLFHHILPHLRCGIAKLTLRAKVASILQMYRYPVYLWGMYKFHP